MHEHCHTCDHARTMHQWPGVGLGPEYQQCATTGCPCTQFVAAAAVEDERPKDISEQLGRLGVLTLDTWNKLPDAERTARAAELLDTDDVKPANPFEDPARRWDSFEVHPRAAELAERKADDEAHSRRVSLTEQLGNTIAMVREALAEAEKRAPLELAGRIATHGPMRDERDLATVYCELVSLLHLLFMPADPPTTEEPHP